MTAYFPDGTEDMEVQVTSLVEEWLATADEATVNHGIAMMFATSSFESATSSSYVKKFFARGSEFEMKRPIIECRWDDSKRDSKGRR